jgi:hypothetical protein
MRKASNPDRRSNVTNKSLFASDAERTVETACLNDLARTAPKTVHATWLATSGVAALIAEAADGADRGVELIARLGGFTDFDEGDDPDGERDFGAFDLWGEQLFWKIDYYHPDRDEHSPVKWSTELTRRVLTIMLASEY